MLIGKVKSELFAPTFPEDRLDANCFNLIVFDLCFLPLFPLFSVSLTLPVIVYWYYKRNKYFSQNIEHRYFKNIIIIMILSTFISLIYWSDMVQLETTFVTSVKRFFQYLTSFWLYYLLYYFFYKYKRNISNIIFWALLNILVYALIYTYNQELFISLKQTLCPFDPQVARWLDKTLPVYRFNYLWADPNNVAYAISGLSAFYLVESSKESVIRKYIVIIVTSFVLITTMSIGGIAVFGAILGFIACFTTKLRGSKKAICIGVVMIIIIINFIGYYWDFFYEILESGLLKRTEIYGDDGLKGGGGRLHDLLRGLNYFNPMFFLVGSGKEGFVTEIGHIYISYMYGIPVYIFFIYILFRKRYRQTLVEYMPILPFFVAFTINIAIIEQKVLLFLILFSAYYSAKCKHKCEDRKQLIRAAQ